MRGPCSLPVEQPAGRLEPVDVRHADVHQDHVRLGLAGGQDGRRARRPPRRRPRSRAPTRGSCGSRPGRATGRRRSGLSSSHARLDAVGGRSTDEPAAGPRAGLDACRRRARRARAARSARGRVPSPAASERPSLAISSSSSSSRQRTVTQACAGPAYLSAFVSASWTTRYAARSTPGASSRGSPSTASSTGSPASRIVPTSTSTARMDGCGEKSGIVPCSAQQPDQPPHLGERLAAGRLDRLAAQAARAPARAAAAAGRHPPGRSSPRRSARSRRGARARCAPAPRRRRAARLRSAPPRA